MTDKLAKEHDALLREWVKRLGLQNWRISLDGCCIESEMELQGCAGCTTWQEVNQCAKVQIISPDCYGDRIIPFDWEKTLVHELLHLKTCLLTDTNNELNDRIGHILIDDLARALVDAKRSGK